MRAAAWWPVLWSDQMLESIELAKSPRLFGRYAYDALGRYAPQCAVFAWIWDLVPLKVREAFPKLIDKGDPPPLFQFVAGVATRQLMEQFKVSRDRFPSEAPSHEEISKAFDRAAETAIAELVSHMERNVRAVRELV